MLKYFRKQFQLKPNAVKGLLLWWFNRKSLRFLLINCHKLVLFLFPFSSGFPNVWLWFSSSTMFSCWMKPLWCQLGQVPVYESISLKIISLTFFSPLAVSLGLWAIHPLVPGHPISVRHGLPLEVWASGWTSHLWNPQWCP